MKPRIMLVSVALLVLGYAALAAGQVAAPASVAARIRSIRSVTFYDHKPWDKFSLPDFEAALDQMRRLGANTVWLVLPWHHFQPVALPEPQWSQSALDHLEQAVTAAERRGMSVILPLCYLGMGWEPKGIDARIWTVAPTMYGAFSRYVLEMVARLSAHRNLIYLLDTEASTPKMDSLRRYPQAVAAFRAWCRETAPDIQYWNARWGTDYQSWEQVQPIDYPAEHGNARRMTDHWRWGASILRQTHGALAWQIKQKIRGQALIGYHDNELIVLDWAKGDSPMPTDNPYDFLSLAYYPKPLDLSQAQFQTGLRTAIARCRARYPGLPLAMLETGADTHDFGLTRQASVVRNVAVQANFHGLGLNIWMWKDYALAAEPTQASYGLLTAQGQPKPAFEALRQVWALEK